MQTPQVVEMNEDKSRLLRTTFFPDIEREDTSQADESYPTPKFTFTPITDDQIYRMIKRLGPYKAPGPDGIPNAMLIRNADLIVLYLGPLYWATFKLGIYPDNWIESTTIVLRKPGKSDYSLPNAHRPVALLNTIGKVLSACVAEDLTSTVEEHGLLPSNHFGCRPGRTTMDSLHYVTKYIKDALRRKEVVSALFLDINNAFPSVAIDRLAHNMRSRGVPREYTDWITCKVTRCQTTLKFDGYKSEPLPLSKGLDQGCPLPGIAFQLYNANLIDIRDIRKGEDAVAFMDDTLLLAWGKNLTDTNVQVKQMMTRRGGGLDWTKSHQCKFALEKFGIMGLT